MPKGPPHGGGSRKGKPNKFTATLRSVFEQTFLDLQKVKQHKRKDGTLTPPVALKDWARENPLEFYKIVARFVPQEHSGLGGGPIPLAVSGTVTLYIPDNGRAAPTRGNGGNGQG